MPARPLGTSTTAASAAAPAVPSRWRHLGAAVPATAIALGLALTPMAASAQPAPAAATSTATVLSDRAVASVAVLTAPVSTARVAAHTGPRPAARPAVNRAGLVLRVAASLRGRPYHFGAVGPRSFDCSGFTRYVFARAVHRSLPHSSAAQYRLAHKIAKTAIRPGDLVFFVSGGHVYHVGIYAGHGLIWHAPHTGDHVRLARISTSSWVAGRVL
jgi:cell wall-associated NlpC family hydrolase